MENEENKSTSSLPPGALAHMNALDKERVEIAAAEARMEQALADQKDGASSSPDIQDEADRVIEQIDGLLTQVADGRKVGGNVTETLNDPVTGQRVRILVNIHRLEHDEGFDED